MKKTKVIILCGGRSAEHEVSLLSARNVLGDAEDEYRKYFNYFSNERYFWLPSSLGKIVGKPILFSLSNSWAKFKQVDQLREMQAGQKEF